MVDNELVEKKLAFIETCVSDLRRLAHPEMIASDVREERFVAHTLQLAIQASLDVASHLVSDLRLGEPETNRQLFELLKAGIGLQQDLAESLVRMAGFRNILVHGYQVVDKAVLRSVLESRLDDLTGYCASIRAAIAAGGQDAT